MAEMLGGGAALLAPEPVATKVIGAGLVVHGLDNYLAGFHTLWTGDPVQTRTAASAMEGLGASPESAAVMGEGVNMIAGLGLAGAFSSGAGAGAKAVRPANALRTANSAVSGETPPTLRSLVLADSIIEDELISEFYGVTTATGGRIWVSRGGTKQIGGVVETVGLESQSGKPVTLLSGAHGTEAGELVHARSFFREDVNYFARTRPDVRVVDITTLSNSELGAFLREPISTICAWCYSERSIAVLKALGLIE